MKRKLGARSSGLTSMEAARNRTQLQLLRRKSAHYRAKEEFAAEASFGSHPASVSRRKADGSPGAIPVLGKADAGRSPAEARPLFIGARWPGYAGLLASGLALFIYPVGLALTGMLLGVAAYLGGQRKLAAWAVAVGLLALVGYFLLVPRYT
ncbi:hypothetical protein [Paenibacillus puerhi]|uniref:hypothetical protein n=1 Tax=Paenibacillus puerhi TaxID=2692622 RepID=UPI001356CA13|nr:hypothetical protein [Paenibacillus puerhi]